MTTFIFEISTPTFYKVVEYRSRCKNLGANVRKELTAWGWDTCKHLGLDDKNATLTAYTYDEGERFLKAYKNN